MPSSENHYYRIRIEFLLLHVSHALNSFLVKIDQLSPDWGGLPKQRPSVGFNACPSVPFGRVCLLSR